MAAAPGDGEDEDTDDEGVDGEAVEESRDLLGITADQALYNYNRAGTLVPENRMSIKMEDYRDHIDEGVEEELNRLVGELDIPYELSEFQRTGACILASGKSLSAPNVGAYPRPKNVLV